MGELISGLLIGSVFIAIGVAIFRFRKAITRHNELTRRPLLGASLTRFMQMGDKITFPVVSAVIVAVGVWLIVYTISRTVSGH
jgi:hypothetical protein